jgi:hypothetical protein
MEATRAVVPGLVFHTLDLGDRQKVALCDRVLLEPVGIDGDTAQPFSVCASVYPVRLDRCSPKSRDVSSSPRVPSAEFSISQNLHRSSRCTPGHDSLVSQFPPTSASAGEHAICQLLGSFADRPLGGRWDGDRW